MLLFPTAKLLRLPAINKPATIAIDFLFITRHYHIKSFRIQFINYSNRGESSTNIPHQKGGILCDAVHPDYYLHRRLVVHHPESHTFPYVDAYLSDKSSLFACQYLSLILLVTMLHPNIHNKDTHYSLSKHPLFTIKTLIIHYPHRHI